MGFLSSRFPNWVRNIAKAAPPPPSASSWTKVTGAQQPAGITSPAEISAQNTQLEQQHGPGTNARTGYLKNQTPHQFGPVKSFDAHPNESQDNKAAHHIASAEHHHGHWMNLMSQQRQAKIPGSKVQAPDQAMIDGHRQAADHHSASAKQIRGL